MHRHRRPLHFVAMAVVVALPLLGMSGQASAKVKAKGCHKTHTCQNGGGSGSAGSGGAPGPITVQIDPNPAVETGSSFVLVVVQVETSPSFAGDAVDLISTQFAASCHSTAWLTFAGPHQKPSPTSIILTLDNDGNAQAAMQGFNCAPGQSVVEADLAVAPFYTALGTLTVAPPAVTAPGVYGYPTTSGTVTGGDVETGDSATAGVPGPESDLIAAFEVETSPVYAEQTVEISSPELQARCGEFWEFLPFNNGPGLPSIGQGPVTVTTNATATNVLDDDGNALFLFLGTSCAAGPSVVTADVEAGDHPTYTTTFNVLPPQPTI
jgi:hypothetical protein